MLRILMLVLPAVSALFVGTAASGPEEPVKPTGILVLDNCDDQYQGKAVYKDNLTFLDNTGKLTFRVSGFNNCESIGGSRMVVGDPTRKCIWVIENVGRRIRRFDL